MRKRFRINDVLGVECNEQFAFRGGISPYYINDYGVVCFWNSNNPVDIMTLYEMIESPTEIRKEIVF